MRLLKVSPAKIVACSDKLFAHSISHSLLQALEACLCPMVMLVGEAVRRLRDNEAGLVQLDGLRGEKGSEMSEAEVMELAGALAVNTTLTMLELRYNALGKEGGRAMGEALAVNTTLTQLDLGDNRLGEEGGRAMGEALAVNTTLAQLDLSGNKIGSTGASAISQALEVNKALTDLDLRDNRIRGKGARKMAKALQVNHVLTTLRLEGQGLDERLLVEVDRFGAVNRALDSKVLAGMMSMHARLGAESGLRVLDEDLVRTICDMFCRESKASCLLDDVEEEDSESDEEEGESEEEEEEEVEEDWESED